MTNIIGIAGSLRSNSINRNLLEALAAHSRSVRFEVFAALAEVPLFNEDLEDPAPAGVRRLWNAVRGANIVVFATPEYNQSLPGVLKNALDWLTRDPAGSPLRGKPCAVTGATVGRWGTRIAQQQLKTVLMTCGAKILTTPVLFHADGMTSEPTEQVLRQFMEALIAEDGLFMRAA